MTLEFQILGGIDLRDGQRDDLASVLVRPKRLALLAYLCLESADGPIRRDALLPVFWPEADEAHARAALNQALHVLRSSLGPGAVLTRGRDEVGIDSGVVRCDAVEFKRALASGDRQVALDLFAGDLLPGFHIDVLDFERWLEAARSALRAEALEAALEIGAEEDGGRDPDTALAGWRRALEIAPDSEAAARGLVAALWQAGRRSLALETYEAFARRLELEYGATPGPELEALVGRIREGEAPTTSPGPSAHGFDRSSKLRPGSSPGSPAPAADAGTESWLPAWLRVALPFGLGIATIVALGMWASRIPAEPETAAYDAEVEYGRAWAAWLGEADYDSVWTYASRAIEADSGHARAWALYAYSGMLLATSGEGPARELIPPAHDAARRAVELDDTLAAAWHALATAEWFRWNWESAARSYRRALSLRSRGAWEAMSRADLSALLADLGRCDEAREAIGPHATREPLARPLRSAVVVRVPYLCRDWETAIREADRAEAGGDASFSVLRYRFLARLLAGDLDRAAADLENMQATLGPGPALDGLEAHLLALRGDGPAARRIVSELGERVASGDPFGGVYLSYVEPLAQLYAAVGMHESALGLLEALIESKGHVRRLSSDPLFDPLRDDPRFDALLARMGLICRRADGRQVCQEIE